MWDSSACLFLLGTQSPLIITGPFWVPWSAKPYINAALNFRSHKLGSILHPA